MKLNEVFNVHNCPLCGKEPFVGACEACKVDRATSELHKQLVCGAYTAEQIFAMQNRKETRQ